MICEQNKNTFH